MRKLNFKLILLVSVVLAGVGCKKFIDVNESPNSAVTTNPTLLFANALNTYAASLAGGPNVLGNYWAGYWAHSTSFTTGTPEKTYNFTNGDFDYWGGIYDNLFDFAQVINTADANGAPYLKGPAQVMKAIRFQELVDLYGNVPYSEAFQGLSSLQPKYNTAEDVYDSLIVLLDDAITNLKANTLPSGLSADIYFSGNGSKFSGSNNMWIKFANTVKLRILMRQSLVPDRQDYVKTELQKAISEGTGFLSIDQDITSQPGYSKSVGKLNPFYALVGFDQNDNPVQGRQLYRISEYLIDTLLATDDTTRMKYIAAPAPGNTPSTAPALYLGMNSDYIGVPFGGEGAAYDEKNVSPIGPGRVTRGTSATEAQVVFTAAESFFLQAEASERFGLTFPDGPTKTLYEQGVKESFRINRVPASAADELLAGSANWDAAPDKIKAIIYQKWVALANYNGLESWSELRRNDYPNVPLSVNSARTKTSRPIRLFYPQSEVSANPKNVEAQGAVDVFTGRIFWDVK